MYSLLLMPAAAALAAAVLITPENAFQYESVSLHSGDTLSFTIDRGDGKCDCCYSEHYLTLLDDQGTVLQSLFSGTTQIYFYNTGLFSGLYYTGPCGSRMSFSYTFSTPNNTAMNLTLRDTRTFQAIDATTNYACRNQSSFGTPYSIQQSYAATQNCCADSGFQYVANQTFTATMNIYVLAIGSSGTGTVSNPKVADPPPAPATTPAPSTPAPATNGSSTASPAPAAASSPASPKLSATPIATSIVGAIVSGVLAFLFKKVLLPWWKARMSAARYTVPVGATPSPSAPPMPSKYETV